MRLTRTLATLAGTLTAACAIAVTAAPAQAAPEPSPTASTAPPSVERQVTVDEVLRLNPKAEKISDTEVKIADGMILMLPRNASDSAALAASCSYQYLCAWEHSGGGGNGIRFYTCGSYDLSGYHYPDGAWVGTGAAGAKWNDRFSSLNNNQTTGTRANFYNWEGSWKLVFWTYAPDWRANLAIDKRYDNGGQLNDIIDRVVPC
ncbi:peptidase inhibitor family I36 protein [Sphaerisporangium corydalis]|uniref:Peptidase inhibitor family I36 protein n=1 Tax=Sphaerisporangium corydalis TaxID=1441875 RepID=A0ABV9EHX6_9ACTN|nr:peptidase inhibitor family I36 protein [Sphaerisporangium corydalis]